MSLPRPRLAIGETLADAWRLYLRNWPRLVATAAAGYGVLALVEIVVAAAVSDRLAFALVTLVLTVVAVFWLQGALVLLVQDIRAGREAPSMLELFTRVEPRLWTLVGSGLVAALGVAIGLVLVFVTGLVLFVLPSLVLLTYWSLLTPAVVLEGCGVSAALRTSTRLVRGNALRAFAVISITVVLTTIVGFVISGVLLPIGGAFGFYLAAVVANGVTVPFVALAWTEMYFALRSGR